MTKQREQIGKLLKNHRAMNLEISIDEATELSGLSWPTISKIEKGEPVKWDSVETYAKSMGYALTFKLEADDTDES